MSNGREVPVIADSYVDMEFGTGALKITPGTLVCLSLLRGREEGLIGVIGACNRYSLHCLKKSALSFSPCPLTHSLHSQQHAGHDPNDYEIGKRHSLPVINVMNRDASINANGGQYEVPLVFYVCLYVCVRGMKI